MKNRKNILLAIVLLVIVLSGYSKRASAQDINYKAYTLFVYNFMKYVEWPEDASKGDFVVGVYGDSPIFAELTELAKQKKAKGRNIIVRKVNNADEAQQCHMLYLCSSKTKDFKIIQDKCKNKPLLVVGEREGLAEKGSALSFVTLDDDALKFDINKSAFEEHRLKISSSLLALGTVVK